MAEIKAFKGLRYTEAAGDLGDLCCPPYDVIGEEQRLALLEKNPHNIVRLELPKADDSENDPYVKARMNLNSWLSKGVLADDRGENLYIYEMVFPFGDEVRSVKGFIALVKLEPFERGVILPHENTLSKAKDDRYNLMVATGCNFSQVYSLYSDEDALVYEIIVRASERAPDSEFTDSDGVTHKLWRVWEEWVIKGIASKMANKRLFIADGHHRYETALNYLEYVKENKVELGTAAYIPMLMVNMENPGLTVLPTHRIVRDLQRYVFKDVAAKCAEYFEVTTDLPVNKAIAESAALCKSSRNAFVLYSGSGKCALLALRNPEIMESVLPNEHKALRSLDVSVLHSLVLERLFGIDRENLANQVNLSYTRSAGDAIAEVDGMRANCCFILNPTRVSEIRNVALTGGKMPQKSTYFYPKPTTGPVMNRIFK